MQSADFAGDFSMFKRNKNESLYIIARILAILAVFVIISVVLLQMPTYGRKTAYSRAASVEQIVKRYVVQCYASEGNYPPNLAYLAQNYGLILNEDSYFYFYSAHGANIMPEVKVFVRRGQR